MPLDPNIILGIKPTVELQDPSKVFAEAQDRSQVSQLNQMRMQESGQAMQLNQLNLQKAQQGMQTENAMRQLAADPEFKPDDPDSWKKVASIGGLTAGLEFQKSQRERAKTAFENAKLQHDLMQTHFGFAANNTSDEGVNIAIYSAIKSQIVDQQTGESLRQQLLALPEPQRKEAFLRMSMAAKDQAELDRKKFEFTNVSADKKADIEQKKYEFKNLSAANKASLDVSWYNAKTSRINATKETAAEKSAKENPQQKAKTASIGALQTIGYDPRTGQDSVTKLLHKATGGWAGAGTDKLIGVFGGSTEGSRANAALKTYASKIAMDVLGGKLGAGVSNADVAFIKEQVANVGNENEPVENRLAAWDKVKQRLTRVAGGPTPPSNYKGWRLAVDKNGREAYVSPKNPRDYEEVD